MSLLSGLVQILTILRAREYGMLLVTCPGWQEEVNRYWFLSVGFLNRSTSTFPFLIERDVSKNAKEVDFSQVQVLMAASISVARTVCDKVN